MPEPSTPLPEPTANEVQLARAVLACFRDPDANGENVFLNHVRHEQRRPRFDGTVNLGHLLTAVTIVGAMVVMYARAQVVVADHESRLKALEVAQADFKTAFKQLADNEATALRTQALIEHRVQTMEKRLDGTRQN